MSTYNNRVKELQQQLRALVYSKPMPPVSERDAFVAAAERYLQGQDAGNGRRGKARR